MGTYQIEGGTPLRGELTVHGAKNSVLPILAATLLTGETCVLRNCPRITDVDTALEILEYLGCRTERQGHTLRICTYDAEPRPIPPELTGKMRAAVIFLGALLARFRQGCLSYPGGCALGERPIDLHLRGLEHLGYCCDSNDRYICCCGEDPKGGTVALPFPSVGATENLILGALGCSGTTVLCNVALEPEIGDLIRFLQGCGADIRGQGTVLTIHGGCRLHGTEYGIMADRMEAVTYLAATAATRGDVTLHAVEPGHLEAVTGVFRKAGCDLDIREDRIRLSCDRLRAVSPIRTAPYDGFPTDAQAPIMAVLACARGVSVVEESIFSDRFLHVPGLRAMGARIRASRRYAIIDGVQRLHGAHTQATDLRGGAALVIGALGAEGCSRIDRSEHMERGYEDFVGNLQSLGGKIWME